MNDRFGRFCRMVTLRSHEGPGGDLWSWWHCPVCAWSTIPIPHKLLEARPNCPDCLDLTEDAKLARLRKRLWVLTGYKT